MKYIWYRFFYRRWSRLIHRFGLHYMRQIPVIREDVYYRYWCEWCGFRATGNRIVPLEGIKK